MNRILPLTSIAVLTIVIICGYWYWTTTPEHAVFQIKSAINTHDVDRFEKYVALDEALESIFDQVLSSSLGSASNNSEDGFKQLGSMIGLGMINMLKPNLVSYGKQEIIKYIKTGSYSDISAAGSDAEKFREVVGDFSQLKHVSIDNYSIHKQGMLSILNVPIENKDVGKSFDLEIIMNDKGGYWQVTGFRNIGDILREINAIKQEQVNIANTQLYENTFSVMTINSALVSREYVGEENDKRIHIYIVHGNNLIHDIQKIIGYLCILEADNNDARFNREECFLVAFEDVKSGEEKMSIFEYFPDELDNSGNFTNENVLSTKLWNLDDEDITNYKIRWKPFVIHFNDGRKFDMQELKEYESWDDLSEEKFKDQEDMLTFITKGEDDKVKLEIDFENHDTKYLKTKDVSFTIDSI